MTSGEKKTGEMSLSEIKAAAEPKVEPEVWEWINGGTETEFTFKRNCLALEKIMLRLRVIHGLKTVGTSVKILGQVVETGGAMMFLGPIATHSIKQIIEAAD